MIISKTIYNLSFASFQRKIVLWYSKYISSFNPCQYCANWKSFMLYRYLYSLTKGCWIIMDLTLFTCLPSQACIGLGWIHYRRMPRCNETKEDAISGMQFITLQCRTMYRTKPHPLMKMVQSSVLYVLDEAAILGN